MREALFWEKEKNLVHCYLCPFECRIKKGDSGNCLVRKNLDGKLYTMAFEAQSAVNIDPIEKKPLYHFLPGTKSFSIGTAGCNFHCKNCQNYDISQSTARAEEYKLTPSKIVGLAVENDCESIAYTYNEPTIFFEQVIETAKLASQNGLKNIIVSNGYINEKPQLEFLKYINAANIDLKAFNEDFYKQNCGARLKPVLDAIKRYRQIHLEITRLIIPTLSDDEKDFEEQCRWMQKNLGREVPLHISRFHPMYELDDLPATPSEVIMRFAEIARKYLDFVYLGNIQADNNTYCPKCHKVLIERPYYHATNVKRQCECGYELNVVE